MLRNGSESKMEHELKGGKAKAKAKEKERWVVRKTVTPNLFANNWSKGNGYCRYAAACNFSRVGPQGGDKKNGKKGSTTLPAKAIKRAKKEIMAMVIEGMKGEGETAKPKGSKAAQASNTLLALVRGEKKRGTTSMLSVDLKKIQRILSPRGRSRRGRPSS
jgi:hypothetical protein